MTLRESPRQTQMYARMISACQTANEKPTRAPGKNPDRFEGRTGRLQALQTLSYFFMILPASVLADFKVVMAG